MTDQSHVLYRFYSATGQLLYIGVTNSPPARFSGHRQNKDWWNEVVGISIENYDSRQELLLAERRAIRIERPQYNVVHNREPEVSSPPIPARPSKRIKYKCEACGRTIKGDGYLHISFADIYEAQAAWERFNSEYDGGVISLDDFPGGDQARWRIHHRKCDPNPDNADHWISVGDADTYEKLLWCTAHLLSEDWIINTDWDSFLYRVLGR